MLKVPVREWVEDHVVNDAEHHCRGPDPERQRKHCHPCKTAVLPQTAPRIPEIPEEIFYVVLHPRFAAVLLHLFEAAKSELRPASCLPFVETAGHEVPDPLFQMET